MSLLERQLRNIICDPGRIRTSEPMSRHTTFRIGGPADFLVKVVSRQELSELLALTQQESVPVYLLGRGSNLLVSDEGVRGLVLQLGGELAQLKVEANRVWVGGGYDLPRAAMRIGKMGLGGLEFACAIPGTVGAGLVINAGAHGGDMSQVVRCATVAWPDGRYEVLSAEQIGFGYRTSRLQKTSGIVVEVEMELYPEEQEALQEKMRHHLERRRKTQPLQLPNAGSIFKNPPGDYAGRLIEQAGCKGMTEGGAQVSEKHSNFIVNRGNAAARDVLTLMSRIRKAVQDQFGVRLEPEVKIWGDVSSFDF